MIRSFHKLSQFWQELKRRKVIRTITVYGAAAFVILELVSMSEGPFGLPEWTFVLTVILLSIGFLIAIILSWIYDIHPEGGIVKTEPANETKEEPSPSSSKAWKIASYISFVVIVALILFHILSTSKGSREFANLEKSIAVLPFRNDSPEQTEMYFIDGTMESILDNLCKIKDLRVVSRTSVEQYRDNPKPIPTVGEEMNVSYVIEGSGLKHGDNIRLTIQLIDAKHDQHIWSNTYNRKTKEIFELQSEIAQLVAAEIEAVITPEERQLIEKIPTTSLTAHDYFQQAQEAYWRYQYEGDSIYLDIAEELYREALKYDSTYSQAYCGLADVYWSKHFWDTYFAEDFLDSVLILSDIALSYNNKLSSAYTLKGRCFQQLGELDRAVEELNRAIQFNPNDWQAYFSGGRIYIEVDLVKSLQYFHKAHSLNRGEQLPLMLNRLGWAYLPTGFVEKSKYYYSEAFKLSKDTIGYFHGLAMCEFVNENFQAAIEYEKKVFESDTTSINYLDFLSESYLMNGDYINALKYYKNWLAKSNSLSEGALYGMHRVGWAFWMNGFKTKGEEYFNEQIDICKRLIESGRVLKYSWRKYYDLAGAYACKGEEEKAFENLRIFNRSPIFDKWLVVYIKNDPFFDTFRIEPEFQQIARDVEAKYQAEHERVRLWLEENEML